MNNKICVYTCITGNYDNIKEIENKEKGIDYYCFTNNKNIKSNTWNVVYISDDSLSNVELARKIKILGDPSINNKYDVLVWMDGAVTFKKKIKEFVKTYLGKNDVFVAFKHGERKTIKEECGTCYRFNKETKEKINRLLSFYEKENYPDNNGLIESTVYIKRPQDKKVIETMNLWFDMIINYTHRDQLSFNYCIYKTNLKVKWINEKVFDNEWFLWERHNYKKEITNYDIYYGDIDNYDINCDIKGVYKHEKDTYYFEEKVPIDVEKLFITITDVPCVEYNNLSIKGVNLKQIDIYNNINFKNRQIIYNNAFVICVNKKFSKGDILSLSVDLHVLNEKERFDFINYLAVDNIYKVEEIKGLEKANNEKQEYINNLWKIINGSFIVRSILKLKRIINKDKYNI